MKKIFLRMVGIILVLFILTKIYHFVIINKVCHAIENFINEENRYYSVRMIRNGEVSYKEEILVKDNILKYVNSEFSYYKWKNLSTNQHYTINTKSKFAYLSNELIYNKFILPNMATYISNINQKGIFNSNFFDIYYILPTKYNNKMCYKIVTKNENIIVDSDTYLLEYSSRKTINTENNSNGKIEYTYEFEVGNVTDEDVALPDLTGYKIIDNQ